MLLRRNNGRGSWQTILLSCNLRNPGITGIVKNGSVDHGAPRFFAPATGVSRLSCHNNDCIDFKQDYNGCNRWNDCLEHFVSLSLTPVLPMATLSWKWKSGKRGKLWSVPGFMATPRLLHVTMIKAIFINGYKNPDR